MRSFFVVICGYRRLIRYVLQLVLMLLILSLFSILFIPSGSESYYIALVNFMVLIPMLVIATSFVYVCGKRKEQKKIDILEDYNGNN